MNELHIRPMEADEEGWTEIVLIQLEVGETIGYLRVVEGTEEGPHTWWDARVIENNKRLQRRFIGYEAAILALALRHAAPDVRSLTWE